MNYKKFLAAASAALMIVIVIALVLAPGAWAQGKYKTLYKFNYPNGQGNGFLPMAGLTSDQTGNLYGTASSGGAYGGGTVFVLTPNSDGSWTESVLHSFNGSDGAGPSASLIFDKAGNLYGTTQLGGSGRGGGGVVFELTPNSNGSWTEKVLHKFTGGKDGGYPDWALVLDQAGNLYGTTASGGDLKQVCYDGGQGCGVVFKLTPNTDGSWTESMLHKFTGGKDGGYPTWALVLDQAGNLYGTTWQGGNLNYCKYGLGRGGCGVVFQLTPNRDGSWKEKVLHNFTGGKNGSGPAGLIFDGAGNLYGCVGGGKLSDCDSYGCGVVFELAPNSTGGWQETVLHAFSGKDGAYPTGLTFDGTGNLYGTTELGGNLSFCFGQGCGVVFKLAPNANGGWKETVLHTFSDRPGVAPTGGVIFDAVGNLYGATSGDDDTTYGSVFEITP